MPVKKPPYDIGDDVDLAATVTNAADVLTDPTTLVLTIVCPDGATVTKVKADMTHPSTGVYTFKYRVANSWGVYRVTWTADGAFGVVEQDSFRVRQPAA